MLESHEDLGLPEVSANGWALSIPEDHDFDTERLRTIGPHFEAWTAANAHAILIARHGKLIYERYFTGEDRAWATPLGRVAYHAGLRHDLRSITKSITSMLVGIAVENGWIADLDVPVFSFFPDHSDLRTPEKDRITLRHLLTMSAGFAWSEDLPYSNPANSERRMMEAADLHRYVLEQPIARPAGVAYNYNGGLTALLGAILHRASGRPPDQLAKEYLFDPLGIDDVEWVYYPDGTANVTSGLRMRPRDVAKIGQLVLNKGAWNNIRILSSAWIDLATSPQIQGEGLYFYGFQWWLGRSLIDRQEIGWTAAVGWGGQRLYVIPSLDMTAVVLAGLYDNPILQPAVGDTFLRRFLLPAVTNR
ncbi:serine hydrolase domain-containing protein [Rhizobium leucaenae]|uniref:CubicO group peptidase (Beta-lactamase class C family) n=1 Tax=Rhizobium leucaenae TaxID=29450 RepID=A0A7W7EJR8_9HYPH|nr:serine hydrolase [Rhizobium leucaenae]MBB4566493.1 CubicO group peptidase (beta-lactamase class C family) [Rhizobium leucaenae]MBB6301613.1 CubicO group peptidase (beta-lactamase class C family) [Rhizobium leucaenae]